MEIYESNVVEGTDLLAFLEDPFLGCNVCVGSCWEGHWRHFVDVRFWTGLLCYGIRFADADGDAQCWRWMLLPEGMLLDV